MRCGRFCGHLNQMADGGQQVLIELGYDVERISHLRENGIV
jgi:hypothetical protein